MVCFVLSTHGWGGLVHSVCPSLSSSLFKQNRIEFFYLNFMNCFKIHYRSVLFWIFWTVVWFQALRLWSVVDFSHLYELFWGIPKKIVGFVLHLAQANVRSLGDETVLGRDFFKCPELDFIFISLSLNSFHLCVY